MKKYIIAVGMAVAMLSSATHAQNVYNKEVPCFRTKQLLEYLMNELDEKPMFLGKVDSKTEPPVSVLVLYNSTKNTFSIVEFNQNSACLISSGDNVEISIPSNLAKN